MQATFRELLRPEIIVEIVKEPCPFLVAKESDAGAKLKKLTIKGIPANSAAFKLDHHSKENLIRQLSCLINLEHKLANKKCDLVIVSSDGDPGKEVVTVVLAEMKSKRFDETQCSEQLRNSEIYLNFLISLAKEYHEFRDKDKIKYRQIVIYVARGILAKGSTQQRGKKDALMRKGVRYLPVTLSGYNNSEAKICYSCLVKSPGFS